MNSQVELKPLAAETDQNKQDEGYDAYTAYMKGDEKFGNEHNKFLAALKAMNMHHHERITKVSTDTNIYMF